MRWLSLILFVMVLCAFGSGCSGIDSTGTIEIEYDGAWSLSASVDANVIALTGIGPWKQSYPNPEKIRAQAAKQDSTDNKLTLSIYDGKRIVSGASTREAQGSVSVAYEFPY